MHCCLPDGDHTEAFRRYVGYHVEIAVDPQSGASLRLQLQVDLTTTPLSRLDIMVEYGPVEIGGRKYVCPIRSVSITRVRCVRVLKDWDDAFMACGPYVTMLNDISFDRYHLFRAKSHMLPDFTPTEK